MPGRMKEHRGRFFAFIFSVLFAVVICFNAFTADKDKSPIQFGIDLVGGVNLIYELDTATEKQSTFTDQNKADIRKVIAPFKDVTADVDPANLDQIVIKTPKLTKTETAKIQAAFSQDQFNSNGLSLELVSQSDTEMVYKIRRTGTVVEMKELVARLNERINAGGLKEIKVLQAGPTQVEITVPKATETEIESIKFRISSAGILEFLVGADDKVDAHAKLIRLADTTTENKVIDPATGLVLGKWVTCSTDNGDRDWGRMKTRIDPRDPKKTQAAGLY